MRPRQKIVVVSPNTNRSVVQVQIPRTQPRMAMAMWSSSMPAKPAETALVELLKLHSNEIDNPGKQNTTLNKIYKEREDEWKRQKEKLEHEIDELKKKFKQFDVCKHIMGNQTMFLVCGQCKTNKNN